jgi:hypothetical protein
MNPADKYRVMAGDLISLARAETDPFQKAEYERLAAGYLAAATAAAATSAKDKPTINAINRRIMFALTRSGPLTDHLSGKRVRLAVRLARHVSDLLRSSRNARPELHCTLP